MIICILGLERIRRPLVFVISPSRRVLGENGGHFCLSLLRLVIAYFTYKTLGKHSNFERNILCQKAAHMCAGKS